MNMNLIEDPWIPVLTKQGKVLKLSLDKVLLDAPHIIQIGLSNPMDRFSLLRFLLAVLYWSVGSPRSLDGESWEKIAEKCLNKLDLHKRVFNLLGDGPRFYQTKDFSKDNPKPVNYLIHENPTGTNAWHFRHVSDDQNGLCLSCCALGLIRLPIFTTAGGQGLRPGLLKSQPFFVIRTGNSLEEMLRLSWRHIDMDLGSPIWEDPNPTIRGEKVPLLVGLTWLPRKCWLVPSEKTAEERCSLCGAVKPLVYKSIFENRQKTWSDPVIWEDPHVYSAKKPVRPSSPFDRKRSFASVVALPAKSLKNLPEEYSGASVACLGLYADKASFQCLYENEYRNSERSSPFLDVLETLEEPEKLRKKALRSLQTAIPHNGFMRSPALFNSILEFIIPNLAKVFDKDRLISECSATLCADVRPIDAAILTQRIYSVSNYHVRKAFAQFLKQLISECKSPDLFGNKRTGDDNDSHPTVHC